MKKEKHGFSWILKIMDDLHQRAINENRNMSWRQCCKIGLASLDKVKKEDEGYQGNSYKQIVKEIIKFKPYLKSKGAKTFRDYFVIYLTEIFNQISQERRGANE